MSDNAILALETIAHDHQQHAKVLAASGFSHGGSIALGWAQHVARKALGIPQNEWTDPARWEEDKQAGDIAAALDHLALMAQKTDRDGEVAIARELFLAGRTDGLLAGLQAAGDSWPAIVDQPTTAVEARRMIMGLIRDILFAEAA